MSGQTFVLTQDHLTLLGSAFVGWQDCETGAPEIDPKRPYGNGSVSTDVAELLGRTVDTCPHCAEPIGEDNDDEMMRIHRETEGALAVVLSMATRGQIVVPGPYVATMVNQRYRWDLFRGGK